MDKYTKFILIGIIIVILSFQFFNIFLSNHELSGSSKEYNISKRSERLGDAGNEGISYPYTITMQDLLMFLIAGTLGILIYLDKKGEEGYKEKYNYKTILAGFAGSFCFLMAFFVLFILQYFNKFEISSINFNHWSIYYLIHFFFMVFLAANLILIYFIAIRHEKEQKALGNFCNKAIKFFKTPKMVFVALVITLAIIGLLIGVMDAFYTYYVCTLTAFTQLSSPLLYCLTMALLLTSILLGMFLIYLFGRCRCLRFRLFNSFIAVFIFLVYPSGLWFCSWHILTRTFWPALQHPLPYRIYPFAIFWESWMDYWIMWISLIGYVIMAYLLYKRIKIAKNV